MLGWTTVGKWHSAPGGRSWRSTGILVWFQIPAVSVLGFWWLIDWLIDRLVDWDDGWMDGRIGRLVGRRWKSKVRLFYKWLDGHLVIRHWLSLFTRAMIRVLNRWETGQRKDGFSGWFDIASQWDWVEFNANFLDAFKTVKSKVESLNIQLVIWYEERGVGQTTQSRGTESYDLILLALCEIFIPITSSIPKAGVSTSCVEKGWER